MRNSRTAWLLAEAWSIFLRVLGWLAVVLVSGLMTAMVFSVLFGTLTAWWLLSLLPFGFGLSLLYVWVDAR